MDAYFAAPELYRFALAVGQVDVPITIFTSVEVLKGKVPNDRESTSMGIEKGEALRAELRGLASQEDINSITVRVMAGDRPAIHDRFLLVDDRIWLLGSSFNEFASRGTMMVALSHPVLVRDKLFQARDKVETLETWLEKWQAIRIAKIEKACS